VQINLEAQFAYCFEDETFLCVAELKPPVKKTKTISIFVYIFLFLFVNRKLGILEFEYLFDIVACKLHNFIYNFPLEFFPFSM
jgi:hypothetical protein